VQLLAASPAQKAVSYNASSRALPPSFNFPAESRGLRRAGRKAVVVATGAGMFRIILLAEFVIGALWKVPWWRGPPMPSRSVQAQYLYVARTASRLPATLPPPSAALLCTQY
jgi:hypothetical protein